MTFHQVFLDDIRKRGRIFESGLMQNYLLQSGEAFTKLKDLSILEEMRSGLHDVSEGPAEPAAPRDQGEERAEGAEGP